MKMMLMFVLALTPLVVFGQEKKESTQEAFQKAEKAHAELLRLTKELDKMFPDDEPMAPRLERDHQQFLEHVRQIKRWRKEDEERQAKIQQLNEQVQTNLRRVEEMEKEQCTKVRNDLASGKLNPLLTETWKKLEANCTEREKRRASKF